MVGIPAPPRRPRPQRRAADHLRRLPRLDGECRGVSARRSVAALHGSFLSERLQPCAGHQGPRGEPHAQSHSCPGEPRDAADRKARTIVEDLRAAKMHTAADLVERGVSETLTYYAFPDIHWQKIRTNNPLERIMKKFVGGRALSEHSLTAGPVSTWLQHDCAAWSAKCYMNMRPLYQRKSRKPKPSPIKPRKIARYAGRRSPQTSEMNTARANGGGCRDASVLARST